MKNNRAMSHLSSKLLFGANVCANHAITPVEERFARVVLFHRGGDADFDFGDGKCALASLSSILAWMTVIPIDDIRRKVKDVCHPHERIIRGEAQCLELRCKSVRLTRDTGRETLEPGVDPGCCVGVGDLSRR